jgi:hypothetical protein
MTHGQEDYSREVLAELGPINALGSADPASKSDLRR